MELQDNIRKIQNVSLAIFYTRSKTGAVSLFFQNRKGDGDLYEFVGGKIETDETPLDALAREINEELGISLDVDAQNYRINKYLDFKFSYSETDVVLHTFLLTTHSKFSVSNGSWFSLDEICRDHFPLIEGSRQIVKSLKDFFL